MKYTSVQGDTRYAEPWSAGPLYGTLWALTPEGVPVVIHATKRLQIEYEPPAPPGPRVTREMLAVSDDIMRRKRLTDLKKDWYGRKQLRNLGIRDVEPPTEQQVEAARAITDLEVHNQRASRIYREAHTASTAIADKRIRDLWEAGDDVFGSPVLRDE